MPIIDKRKVHPIGAGGKAIVLHADWCRYWKVKPGDTLDVIGNKILAIIPPLSEVKKEKIENKLRELML